MSGTQKTQHTRILVIDIPLASKMLTLGLVADRVFEVTAFKSAEIEDAPDIGVRWPSEYISGVVRREQGFVVIIDLARLFTTSEAVTLTRTGSALAASA
jgi:purine-binding chemotaxis protein CheW